MKQLISRRSFLKAAGVTAAAASMAIGAPAASACWLGDKSDVTILYTNDVHTYIDKQSPKLTYAAIADLKQSYQNAGKDVLLVDAGDHVQGTAYGSMDEGASIIKLMNAAGYDVATPGNHEFDYGMDRAKAIMKEADFPYLSCNWVDLRTGLRVLPSVKVFVRGGRRIAFVGVTTPETFTKSTLPTLWTRHSASTSTTFRAARTAKSSMTPCRRPLIMQSFWQTWSSVWVIWA